MGDILDIPASGRVAITVALLIALVVASVIPGEAKPGDSFLVWAFARTPSSIQNALHVVLYGVLAACLAWTLCSAWSKPISLTAACLLAILFGSAMELAQLHVPGRFATVVDIGLNAIGSLLGVAVALILL